MSRLLGQTLSLLMGSVRAISRAQGVKPRAECPTMLMLPANFSCVVIPVSRCTAGFGAASFAVCPALPAMHFGENGLDIFHFCERIRERAVSGTVTLADGRRIVKALSASTNVGGNPLEGGH